MRYPRLPMEDLDRKTLDYLKRLCRIQLTDAEEKDLGQSLKNILEYMEFLKEVDTEEVEPCYFVLQGLQQEHQREDVPGTPLSRETFLANAPDQIGGMVRIPPVMGGE